MRRAFLILLTAGFCTFSQSQDESLTAKLSGGYKFATGIVWSRDGAVLFSDAPAGRIIKITSAGPATFREHLDGPRGLALDDDGRLYVCESRARRIIRIDRNGKVEVVCDNWQGKHFNGPNEIAVTKNGQVYFTDPAFGSADAKRELDFYGVYRSTPKGGVELLAKMAGRPNGIAISPDGKLLYIADSDRRAVLAFEMTKNGPLQSERVFLSSVEGVPDGVRTDAAGNVYVAAKNMLVYSPEAKLLRTVPLPEKPSASILGDADGKSLFVTARTSVYRVRPEAEEARH